MDFFKKAGWLRFNFPLVFSEPPDLIPGMSMKVERIIDSRRITAEGGHYFFAYYDKLQFSPDDRFALAQRAMFDDRPPRPDDVLEVGMIDLLDDNRWIPLGTTTAWCWQQGCMLQWLPGHDDLILFNTREDGYYGSVIVDLTGAVQKRLPRAVYTVRPDGLEAISSDFARTGHTRPGYGYVGIPDPNMERPAPGDSGLWRMNLETGENEMIFSIADLASNDPVPAMRTELNWFNHILYNTDGSRIVFLHRWQTPRQTRMYTCRPDGSDLYRVSDAGDPCGWQASHFWWRDAKTIMVWGGSLSDQVTSGYRLVTDRTGEELIINPDLLNQDGHMSYPPGESGWFVSDTYPDRKTNMRLLFFCNESGGPQIVVARHDAGRFNATEPSLVECRCDFHPRWNRAGTRITIDSVHEGYRGVYLLDVENVFP